MGRLSSKPIFLAIVGLGLVGCASGPTIYTNQNPQTDFTSYRTYGYVEQMGTNALGGPTSLLTQYLTAAVDREMAGRGYQLGSVDPDLQINFYLETQEKIQSRTVPTGPTYRGGYYGYRGGYYGTWGGYSQTTEITQYTEGTLGIDVVDNKRDELVWEGVAVGRIREEAMRNLEVSVNAIVPQIMAEYPYRVPPPNSSAD
jgi:hypothetical protein